ncbi:hypothetical protein SAMN05216588_10761 [Pseudomonas flavescens]|uniref:Uncharacterized protein n=1 Tax=Phytopseudomonas flavescens TaxID=29435 RepID=A0A1G8EZL0_9GAMM|nr:hypothetical protein SAMN05216588_10761 [Pseudomonas flavescens]
MRPGRGAVAAWWSAARALGKEAGEARCTLTLSWIENNGPVVREPLRSKGHGTTMIGARPRTALADAAVQCYEVSGFNRRMPPLSRRLDREKD